jgi:putative transposase
MTTAVVEMRAYRFALDLTAAQQQQMREHAGAARWAFNHALAQKYAALDTRQAVITALVEQGVELKTAAAQAPKIPTKPAIQKALNQSKCDDRIGVDGVCPWWHRVSTYAFLSALTTLTTPGRTG